MLAWLGLPVRYALREFRAGLAGFRIFLACLALGTAAIAGVGSLSQSFIEGLRENGQAILGGDVALRLTHRAANEAEFAWLEANATLSNSVEMRTMTQGVTADRRTLVELKAVDDRYPLYGTVDLRSGGRLHDQLANQDERWGAVIETELMSRLGLEIGDDIRIGDAIYRVRDVVVREPDRAAGGIAIGPRVMVSDESLEATGLVQTGSLIRYHYRAKLPPGVSAKNWIDAVQTALPDAGWRIRYHGNAAPSLKRFVDRLTLFLTLVGLSSLLVGGVGIGNAVRSYLDRKVTTIATLKSLGASGNFIFSVYFVQILLLGLIGIFIGLGIAICIPFLINALLGDSLPIPISAGIYWVPLGFAMAYGVLITLAFGLWPLGRAREVPAASLFRQIVTPPTAWPSWKIIAVIAVLITTLAALAILTAPDRRIATYFVGAAAGCFLVLRLAAWLLALGAKHAGRPRNSTLRLALTNLYRPGAATGSVVVSLGLGLTLLVTIALIEGNLSRQVNEQLPERAPSFFFVDIQNHQLDEFLAVTKGIEGVSEIEHVPSLRGRITQLAGRPVETISAPPEAQWVLRGDRGLTYLREPPDPKAIIAGDWWEPDYEGPPILSFEAEAAEALGLTVGDSVTVNVLGREITATIANLRRVDWSTLGINFVLVFDPHSLSAAPHSHMATARADDLAEPRLFDAVTQKFANVTTVRMKEALEVVNNLLAQIGMAIRSAAGVTLISGLLVLGGAMAAGHHRRVYDAVILKVLGATRVDVMRAFVTEYAMLGLLTGLIAIIAGTIAAWFVITDVMNAAWVFLPVTMVLTVVFGVLITITLGLLGTWRALSARPAPVLRTD